MRLYHILSLLLAIDLIAAADNSPNTNVECSHSGWTNITVQCDDAESFDDQLFSIAIQTFIGGNTDLQLSSYSTLSLRIESLIDHDELDVTAHCVALPDEYSLHNITMHRARQWLLNIQPWPEHHSSGHYDGDTDLITFKKSCPLFADSAHAVILVFDKSFSAWKIETNCTAHAEMVTIYDTFRSDIDCHGLPLISSTPWNMHLMSNVSASNANLVRAIFVDSDTAAANRETSDECILFMCMVVLINICCVLLIYVVYRRRTSSSRSRQKLLQHQIRLSNGCGGMDDDAAAAEPLHHRDDDEESARNTPTTTITDTCTCGSTAGTGPQEATASSRMTKVTLQIPSTRNKSVGSPAPIMLHNPSTATLSECYTVSMPSPTIVRMGQKRLSSTPSPIQLEQHPHPMQPLHSNSMKQPSHNHHHTLAMMVIEDGDRRDDNGDEEDDDDDNDEQLRVRAHAPIIYIDEYGAQQRLSPHEREHSLCSLPSLPPNNRFLHRNISASTNHDREPHNRSNSNYLLTVTSQNTMDRGFGSDASDLDAVSEHHTLDTHAMMSELDDSILNDDYQRNLDHILGQIQQINVDGKDGNGAGNTTRVRAKTAAAEEEEDDDEDDAYEEDNLLKFVQSFAGKHEIDHRGRMSASSCSTISVSVGMSPIPLPVIHTQDSALTEDLEESTSNDDHQRLVQLNEISI